MPILSKDLDMQRVVEMECDQGQLDSSGKDKHNPRKNYLGTCSPLNATSSGMGGGLREQVTHVKGQVAKLMMNTAEVICFDKKKNMEIGRKLTEKIGQLRSNEAGISVVLPRKEAIATPGKVRQLVERIDQKKNDNKAKETGKARKIAIGGRGKKRLLVLKGQKKMESFMHSSDNIASRVGQVDNKRKVEGDLVDNREDVAKRVREK